MRRTPMMKALLVDFVEHDSNKERVPIWLKIHHGHGRKSCY
jgi:hypothetical protein